MKNHRWFKDLDFTDLYFKKLEPPYKPKSYGAGDTCNFENWPESKEKSQPIKKSEDPFEQW